MEALEKNLLEQALKFTNKNRHIGVYSVASRGFLWSNVSVPVPGNSVVSIVSISRVPLDPYESIEDFFSKPLEESNKWKVGQSGLERVYWFVRYKNNDVAEITRVTVSFVI